MLRVLSVGAGWWGPAVTQACTYRDDSLSPSVTEGCGVWVGATEGVQAPLYRFSDLLSQSPALI